MRDYWKIFQKQLNANRKEGIVNPKYFYVVKLDPNTNMLATVQSKDFSKLNKYGFNGKYTGFMPKFFVR
jgi:hypothetical protein